MPALFSLLMIAVFAGVMALVLWAAAKTSKRASDNLGSLARTLGLRYEPGTPVFGVFYPETRASGQRRGKFVEAYSYSTGSGKSRIQWCAVAATPAGAGGLTFSLRPQGLGTKLMEMFGSHEIQVGDAEFDRRWYIQTNQPDFLRAALLPEVRAKLDALANDRGVLGPQVQLEKGVVRYAEQGSFSDPARTARLTQAMEVVCDLADLAEVFAARA